MGKMERTILRQSAQAGIDLPERVKNAPELLQGLSLYYTAFYDLNSCRQTGMGVGLIPWTAIDRYCEANGIVGEQREDMFDYIASMDETYRAFLEKKNKVSTGGSTPTKKTPPKPKKKVRRR